jgi:hypothetical protein
MVLSTRWSVVLGSAAILALVLVSGCATPSPASQQARLRKLRTELIARGDPDSLAAAAMFERLTTGQWHDAPDLASRATTAAPERRDLAFLQLSLCYLTPACKPESFADRLRQLDPANGITWIFALGRATRANDAAAVSAALTGLEQSQRVDLYWPALVSHLSAAVSGHAGFDQMTAFVNVVGIDAAIAIPPLQPVSTSCSKTAIANEDILARCRRMIAALEHADSILLESYGNHLAARLWPEASAEGIAIASRRRVLDYQMQLWSVQQKKLNSPQAIRTLARLYGRYSTEQATFLALYADLGLSPDP